MWKSYFLSLVALSLFLPSITRAGNSIVINEIAWMGTITSVNDEWIELYNPTNIDVNIDGWTFKTTDDKLKINLKGTTPANGFYLLERTDDNTVLEIAADLIYTGALNNSGMGLELYDASGDIADEIDCSAGWTSGDNITKQTLEKTAAGWQTSQNPGGTPKAQNSIIEQSIVEAEVYPDKIFFKEILPSPEGADDENEYIKIYNGNDFEVDLTNWKVEDTTGTITTYTFPETKLGAGESLTLTRPVTKITLNNSGDGLILYNPKDEIIDQASFDKALVGQIYRKTDTDWRWIDSLTKTPKDNISKDKEEIVEKDKLLASLNNNIQVNNNFKSLILTAVFISFISSSLIIFLKRKLKYVRS